MLSVGLPRAWTSPSSGPKPEKSAPGPASVRGASSSTPRRQSARSSAGTPPHRFEGYYANDEADAVRTRNGWFWSGDLGYRDDQGTFYFAGRGDDWLRVDGENFAAAPVETILGRHPDVAACVVFAVPDPRTGDQVMAALELEARDRVRSCGVRQAFWSRNPIWVRSGPPPMSAWSRPSR